MCIYIYICRPPEACLRCPGPCHARRRLAAAPRSPQSHGLWFTVLLGPMTNPFSLVAGLLPAGTVR